MTALRTRVYPMRYETVPGVESAQARQLVDYCLGAFTKDPVPKFSLDISYLERPQIILLESMAGKIGVTQKAGLHEDRIDQKMVVDAWISQRTAVPDPFRCWMIRGDGGGKHSIASKGLHISAVRRKDRRDLVLVPSANRERYLGPRLAAQMRELRHLWGPWKEKSDSAWWGGDLTGLDWATAEPPTLTRWDVLSYFRDHPSEQVHLHLADSRGREMPGIQASGHFTKADAFSHKCLVLLPGNDIPSGLSWFFASNSVVLMQEPHLEHILYFMMKPWVHYVPLEPRPSDILIKLEWVLSNADRAQEIVRNAQERLNWFCGPEYLWACNEVMRRIGQSGYFDAVGLEHTANSIRRDL